MGEVAETLSAHQRHMDNQNKLAKELYEKFLQGMLKILNYFNWTISSVYFHDNQLHLLKILKAHED